MNCPSSGLLFACRQVRSETEQMVGFLNQLACPCVRDPEPLQVFVPLFLRERDEFRFDLCRYYDGTRIMVLFYVSTNLLYKLIGICCGQVSFSHIAGEKRWLCGQKEEALHRCSFLRCQVERDNSLACIQMGFELVQQLQFGNGF